jgi:hypothetical protein
MTSGCGIQDAQPPHPQHGGAQGDTPFIIRPAVNQPLEHPTNQGGIGAVIGEADETGDPTHGDPQGGSVDDSSRLANVALTIAEGRGAAVAEPRPSTRGFWGLLSLELWQQTFHEGL